MNATDYYEARRAPRKHVHDWYRRDTDAPRTQRCDCGRRRGVLTSAALQPAGMTAERALAILRGAPCVPAKAPRSNHYDHDTRQWTWR